ncbi:uncharacterized protein LOC132939498 [Metopolophium dirhodum]|uniref:uncharacterized protein LOC132939498 n=1 Tax=Metopolophium dirhodum TaxID=44670 RepID=UPI00298FA961|nr:uncharacterized protein LOC132939498 [Metopolophium dirhodum]
MNKKYTIIAKAYKTIKHESTTQQTLVIQVDPEFYELTSLIYLCCYELSFIGKFIFFIWRIYFDNPLSMVLTELESIHEKLIRLNVKLLMNITYMNWIPIVIMIVNVMVGIIATTLWIISHKHLIEIKDMVMIMVLNTCQCFVLFEYILLISYIKWMVYMINEQIPERRSCLSTYRDMYLEVIECLHQVNRSIYGVPAIVVFIAANVAENILCVYNNILFPRDYENDTFSVVTFIWMLTRTVNVLILFMIGDVTEKEVNRMSFVFHQRSLIERNPRIKRQIKFFLLRRLHEHYYFELYGMFHINIRQLFSLLNKAIGYLVIQILFKLNK